MTNERSPSFYNKAFWFLLGTCLALTTSIGQGFITAYTFNDVMRENYITESEFTKRIQTETPYAADRGIVQQLPSQLLAIEQRLRKIETEVSVLSSRGQGSRQGG